MAWGGGGAFGGGGMGGGVGGQFRGGGAQAAGGANGLPFAGIPAELAGRVDRLVATEPELGEPTVTFTHRRTDRRPLTLRRMMDGHWRTVIIVSVLVVIETVTLQAGPALTQMGIDDGLLKNNAGRLMLLAFLYILCVVLTAVASGGRVAMSGRLAGDTLHDLRVRIFGHLQRMSLDYYTDEKAGVIMTRMTSDVEALQQLLQDGLAQFAVQGLTMVLVTAVLFTYNVRLAIITLLLIVPLLTAFSLWFRAASDRGYGLVRDGIAKVLSDLQESLSGVRVVAAYNRFRHNFIHHRNVVGEYRDANDYTAQVNAIYGPGTEMLGAVGQGLLLLIGGRMVLRNQLTTGELIAFILYINQFFLPIQQLVQLYNTYQQGQAAIVKLRGLLQDDPTVLEASDAVVLPPITGAITFERVSFGYDPANPVLHDVDLQIAAGETLSLVGPTGAGKSTVAKLVTRFYDPTAGRVLIDDYDMRSVTLQSLRSQLGVVPQEPFLFAGTIRDNISFAKPDATDDEVREAVERVGLTDLVARMPDGLDTPVHERGQSLSSGERQLLALARAFITQPRVLVLDEATSNLDLQSETKIEAALDVLLEGRTAILIAHRLSTAMRADRIVVVDHGGIVEIGSHAELVAKEGRYAEMYATWISHTDPEVVAEH